METFRRYQVAEKTLSRHNLANTNAKSKTGTPGATLLTVDKKGQDRKLFHDRIVKLVERIARDMIHVIAYETYTSSAVEHYCYSLNSLLQWISNNEVRIRPSPSLFSSGIAAAQIDKQSNSFRLCDELLITFREGEGEPHILGVSNQKQIQAGTNQERYEYFRKIWSQYTQLDELLRCFYGDINDHDTVGITVFTGDEEQCEAE